MKKPQTRNDVASKPLLAFVVTNRSEEVSLLVWEFSASAARTRAHRSDWFEYDDWIDLRVRREPKADGLRDHPSCIGEQPTSDEFRLMRNLFWREVDGAEEPCKRCEKLPWHDIPESALNEDGLCGECVEDNDMLTVSGGRKERSHD